MPAALPKPVQVRIAEMRAAGARITDIAADVGADRNTVAKYTARFDRGLGWKSAAAAGLSDAEVVKLQVLARQTREAACPTCGRPIVYLIGMADLMCGACGQELTLRKSGPTQGSPHAHGAHQGRRA